MTWKKLADRWHVRVRHGGYREDGTWYHLLRKFPAAYFDRHGYLPFEGARTYRACPGALFAKDTAKNWANFPQGIASVDGYVRCPSDEEENDGQEDELVSAFEGVMRMRYVRHRTRERQLRHAKIRAVLAASDGRLRCEVPGCAFDFEATYGIIGERFAHVHHLDGLANRDDARATTLDELAIVCANCHAMIHVGGECRRLEEVAPRRRRA